MRRQLAERREPAAEPRGRGRPRLGVVAREVTLLPRHWEWLAAQPGGASVTLRRLVDAARRSGGDAHVKRAAQEAAYRFMLALAGNLPGFEEAIRPCSPTTAIASKSVSLPGPGMCATMRRGLRSDPAIRRTMGIEPSPSRRVRPADRLRILGTANPTTPSRSGCQLALLDRRHRQVFDHLRYAGAADASRAPAGKTVMNG